MVQATGNPPLAQRCYLVTGGAGAIGFGIAQAIAELGGRAVLLDIDAKAAAANARRLNQLVNNCCRHRVCDVTTQADVVAAVQFALDTCGRLDGAVNNAGLIHMNTAAEASATEWRQHFEVNATGAFVVAQAVAAHLQQHGGGAIVNVASNCGKVGYPNMAAYNASKAAMISMTRSLAAEWVAHGINVNAVCPGGVDTPMLDKVAQWLAPRLETDPAELLQGMGSEQLQRRIQPVEVGRVVAFLLTDSACIIRGQAINVDGGDTPY